MYLHMNYAKISTLPSKGPISIFFKFWQLFFMSNSPQVGWDTPAAVHANEASIIRYEALGDGHDLQ